MPEENEDEALLDPSNEQGEVTEGEEEETDEWGNPVGTEYDDDGNAIPEVELVEPEVTVAATPARLVPASIQVAPTMTAEERAYAEEIFTPQQLAFMEGLTARAVSAAQHSFSIANSAVESSLSDASPDYRRMVVPQINAVFARMTPQQRADPYAADDALAVVMTEEARQTGESIITVMTRHLQMRGGTTPAKRPPVAVRPPATRAPAPSSAGRGSVVRGRVGTPSASKNIQLVANTLGITVAEAEAMGLK